MKKNNSKYIPLYFIVLTLFFACSGKPDKKNTQVAKTNSYAVGFSIHEFENYKELIVFNPWVENAEYAKYYLVKNENINVPDDGLKIRIPLKSLAATSVTYFEFLSLIDELSSVAAICSPELVYNEKIKEQFEKGAITDLGDAFSLNIEKVLLLQPNAIMLSGYNQNDANVNRIAQSGIPILYNNEWMETSLLARAEWIKFVAAFYDKEDLADSIFREVEENYISIKQALEKQNNHPSVMSGSNFRGTWYMPGGNSYMGKLFADAGADYFYADNESSGSLALNVETVIKNFSEADVWLNCTYSSFNELMAADSKNALFKSVKNREVYNFNKRLLPSGANDFWESALARPDLLLADVIAVLHPHLLPSHELIYTLKLD